MSVPQITIFLDLDGNLRCEAPGANGTRKKINVPSDFKTAMPELYAELVDQADAERARKRANLMTKQRANVQYVSENHSLELAGRIWSDPELLFNRALGRKLREAQIEQAQRDDSKLATKKKYDPALAIDIKL